MLIEKIFRAAQRANDIPAKSTKTQQNTFPPPEQEDKNDKKNWYKKTWCIIFFLIVFYPIGLILLWISPRISFQLKGIVTIAIIFSVLHFDVGNSFVTRILPSLVVKTDRATDGEALYQDNHIDSETVNKQSTIEEKKIYAGSEKRSCLCIKKLEDIDDFIAAAEEWDVEYIGQIPWVNKGFFIDEDVRVLCDESKTYRGMVFVTILEGKYKDFSGYTFSKRVRKVKKASSAKGRG